MTRSTVLFLVAALAVWTASTVDSVARTCRTEKSSVTTSTLSTSTNSKNFIDVQEGAVSFNIAGTNRTCIIVEFHAQASAGLNEGIFVRAVLDGSTVGQPAEVRLTAGNPLAIAHSFPFVFPGVLPGPHTIQVQLKSFNGTTVSVYLHATIVHHR